MSAMGFTADVGSLLPQVKRNKLMLNSSENDEEKKNRTRSIKTDKDSSSLALH